MADSLASRKEEATINQVFKKRSIHRLSQLLDCGLTEEQLNSCVDLLEAKFVNPEALAHVVNQMKAECKAFAARRQG